MKLRILDDTIRLRLERTEVEALGAGTAVACSTHFPGGAAFGYRLETAADAAEAEFSAGAITVRLPANVLRAWAEDETAVSIRESFDLAEGMLAVLVEKDFECLEPRAGESQANRFQNPKAASESSTT